ncbi:tudor and KH domain-containing protein-like [Antedon mediterranea]|uniref:tudor and KH domain-containing protein-like n=1 Tax=Antedon mediterranea TaxID=105859 RepID=UPI003AF9ED10
MKYRMGLTNRQVAALVVTVPLSAFFLYLLFKKQEEDDDYFPENGNKSVASGQQTIVEIKVPSRCAAAIIGRDGSNIKKIQADTGAKVNFQDRENKSEESTGYRVVKIRGKVENVMLAERLVRKCIESAPVINTVEIIIPKHYIGRIIGKSGTNIRSLCEISQAKIKIERGGNNRDPKLCKISGTDEQIAFAKSLLDEEIRKEDEIDRRNEIASQDRKPRGSKLNSPAEEINYKLDQPVKQPKSITSQEQKSRLMPLPDHSDYFAVFISAVEHPGHFWMQILGSPSKALNLDILMQSMTEYFSRPVDGESDKVSCIRIGDIVAAPFQHDDNWYRAKVVGFLDEGLVDVYYVDYGDNGSVHREQLKELRSDFLGLPHQATECCLAGVEPLNEFWSEAAIDKFEELTYCAQWKPLMAKVLSYKSTENGTLPSLELVDTNKEEDILIASKLRESGLAIKETTQVSDEHTLFPSINETAKMIQENAE